LHNLARHGPDIGPPVTANFGFVPHATQRQPDVLAPCRARYGFGQRRFADARRADEAKDRPFHLFGQRLDRQIFDNAFLGLLQTEMVLVEDTFGRRQVLVDLTDIEPGQADQPVDIVAHNRGFGRHGRHHLQFAKFLFDLLGALLGHFFGFDPFG
jgi:hypothetical protein